MEVFFIAPQLMGGAYPKSVERVGKLLEVWKGLLTINLAQEMDQYWVDGVDVENWPVVDGRNMAFGNLVELVSRIYGFINEGSTQGVFVHCKHGKGRTGSVLIAYLMFKYHVDVNSANALLAQRHRLYNKGVTIKGQLKYLHYWQKYLSGSLKYHRDTLWMIDSIQIVNGSNWRFQFEIASIEKCEEQCGLHWNQMGVLSSGVNYQSKLITNQDICIQIKVKSLLWMTYSTTSLNLSFEKSPVSIKFNDMDGYRGTNHKGKTTFDEIIIEYHQIEA